MEADGSSGFSPQEKPVDKKKLGLQTPGKFWFKVDF